MKRILPVLMSLVLVLSLIAVPAQAAEGYTFTWSDFSSSSISVPDFPEGFYYVSWSCTLGGVDFTFSDSCPRYVMPAFDFGDNCFGCIFDLPSTITYCSDSNASLADSFMLGVVNDATVPDVYSFVFMTSGGQNLIPSEAGITSLSFTFTPLPEGYVSIIGNGDILYFEGLPAGKYELYLVFFDDALSVCAYSLSPITLTYDSVYTEVSNGTSHEYPCCYLTASMEFPVEGGFPLDLMFIDSGFGVVPRISEDGVYSNVDASSGMTFLMVPVDDSPASLSAILDGVDLSGVLDQVGNVLPAVLVVIVGAIGLRKGISWIQGILHGA